MTNQRTPGPFTVELEGIKGGDGRPVYTRLAIYDRNNCHIPFDEQHRAFVQSALNSHDALIRVMESARAALSQVTP